MIPNAVCEFTSPQMPAQANGGLQTLLVAGCAVAATLCLGFGKPFFSRAFKAFVLALYAESLSDDSLSTAVRGAETQTVSEHDTNSSHPADAQANRPNILPQEYTGHLDINFTSANYNGALRDVKIDHQNVEVQLHKVCLAS